MPKRERSIGKAREREGRGGEKGRERIRAREPYPQGPCSAVWLRRGCEGGLGGAAKHGCPLAIPPRERWTWRASRFQMADQGSESGVQEHRQVLWVLVTTTQLHRLSSKAAARKSPADGRVQSNAVRTGRLGPQAISDPAVCSCKLWYFPSISVKVVLCWGT